MLVQPTQDEGASSERLSVEQPSPSPAPTSEVPNESLPDSSSAQPSEVPFEQQPDPSPRTSPKPSPRPSPTPIVPDSIPEPTGENLGDHSSNDASLSGNEDDMTLQNVYDLCISLCQQVPLFYTLLQNALFYGSCSISLWFYQNQQVLLHQTVVFYQSSCRTSLFSWRSLPLAILSPFLQDHIHQPGLSPHDPVEDNLIDLQARNMMMFVQALNYDQKY
ncbi:hypothetical protein Tco_0209188 [Tanacetum coccineum]